MYALREVGTNFVKIGKTVNFEKRFSTLSFTCNPRPLVLLGWLSQNPDDEALFHAKFSQNRVFLGGGTEWFLFSEPELAVFCTHLIVKVF